MVAGLPLPTADTFLLPTKKFKNMKTITLLFIAITLFFANVGSVYASFATSDFEESEDDLGIIDTDIIYAPQKLRNILNFYSKLDFSKQEDRLLINNISIGKTKNIEEYLKLFKEKFIIFEVTKYKHKNRFCKNNDYAFSVAINPKNIEKIFIIITEDNKICRIIDGNTKDKRFRDDYLLDKKYTDRWL